MVKAEDVHFVRYKNCLGGKQPKKNKLGNIDEESDIIALIRKTPIEYGGNNPVDISTDDDCWYVTFKADNVYVPREPIVLNVNFRFFTYKKDDDIASETGLKYKDYVYDMNRWKIDLGPQVAPKSLVDVRREFENAVKKFRLKYPAYYK